MILDRNDSFLLVIDMQERLVPAVMESEKATANCLRLMKAAELLAVPVFLTEHCADRIGRTIPILRERVNERQILQKTHFSAWRDPPCRERISALNLGSAVVAGTEAHVCVLQTALDLKAAGLEPRLVVDAVSTRHADDRSAALDRARNNGIETVTLEMVLFEWLENGESPAFRDVLKIVKEAETRTIMTDRGTKDRE
jgi:nicotinamidase-related amidase